MDDKKKLAVLGVLAAVIVAVGAFQFMSPAAPIEDPGAKTASAGAEPAADPNDGMGGAAEAPKKDAVREALLGLATSTATPRDPFVPSGELMAEFNNALTKAPGPSAAPPPVVGTPPPSAPSQTASYVPPMDPLPGGMGGPQTGPIGVTPTLGDGANLSPSKNTEEFGYKVRGVIVGTSKMVVLEDSAGNQKLVPVGASVDGDSTVVAIKNGVVQIRHRGRKTDVKLEEDSR